MPNEPSHPDRELERFRDYLSLLARLQLDAKRFRAKSICPVWSSRPCWRPTRRPGPVSGPEHGPPGRVAPADPGQQPER